MALGLHNIHYPAHIGLAEREVLQSGGEVDPLRVARVCGNKACAKTFYPLRRHVRRGRGRFCSRSCASVVSGLRCHVLHPQSGEANHNFKGWCSRNKRAYVDRFRAKYPEKARAHDVVKNALEKGILVRPESCQRCGVPCHPHGHHFDYSKPLDVLFVCRPCHRIVDRERQQAEGAQ